MDITVRDRTQADTDEMPRRPVLVIAFAISATMLWSGFLLWILSRMIFIGFAGLDPSAAGAVAALIVMLCLLAFNHARRQGVIGALARIALVIVGAVVCWVALAWRSDVAAERPALDAAVPDL